MSRLDYSGAVVATLLAAALALTVAPAFAGTITVLNPDFELPPGGAANAPLPFGCGPGCSYSEPGVIPDWATTGDTGLFEPGVQVGNFTYFNSVPSPITVAYTNSGTISQTVGTTSVAGDTYTLQVDVGFRKDVPDLGSVYLDIGGVSTLATGTPSQGSGNWSTYTASYTAPTSGQPISILLESSSVQGDWDNVSLTATPLPSTWTMLIAGFVGVGFFVCRGAKNRSAAIAAA
jgi:hypothetical protein